MHIFNISVTYLQSVEKMEFVSQNMHYQPLFARCSSQTNGYVKNPISLVKNIFSASNFFMHIFNISVTYLQSVEKIQWKL